MSDRRRDDDARGETGERPGAANRPTGGPADAAGASTGGRSDVARMPSPGADERAPHTLLNALLGAVVAVVLSALPFSPVLGGVVAGYLEGGDYRSGATVGAIAGLLAFVPFVAIAALVLAVFAGTAFPAAGVGAALWVSVILILLVAAVYTIGLGAVGGVLGIYVRQEV